MTPDEFRRRGREVVEWIASYMQRVEDLPVLSPMQPGQVQGQLPPQPPETGEPFEAVMRDLDAIIVPGLTNWQSPNFFGYFPANASGPAILGELLSAGLGVQGMLWASSPACTELETHVLGWVATMLDLPERFSTGSGGGVIQDTASSATLCALLAARERATNLASNEHGVSNRLVAYTSTQAHSSVEKAVKIAGIGRANLRPIEHDGQYAMRVEALQAALVQDVRDGLTPFFVCATVGTTASNAIDPVGPIGELCRQHQNMWLHVDAAMSGTAALCPEYRFVNHGLELADSYCFNPHKWMLTNFDCDCFFVADTAALVKALSILPEYLRNAATESGAVIDYRDWQIPLGRRFRALKLWMVIRHYGVRGLQAHVQRGVELAREFAAHIAADDRFELLVEPVLNLVCFRLRGDDDANRRLLEQLNASGRILLTHAVLDGRYCLRMAIGGTWTQRRHVEAAWQLIRSFAGQERPEP